MIWNNCSLISQDGEFTDDFDISMMPQWQNYCTNIRKNPSKNVWYDRTESVCFGLEQTWLNSLSRNSFFISDSDSFIYGHKWDKNFVMSYFGEIFGNNTVENNEIVYLENPQLNKIKGTKVLIVGGGPTTDTVDWDPKKYDHVFSCNHFFLNDKIKNCDVTLATVTTEVDLSEKNTKFHDYLNKTSTVICFEDRLAEPDKQGLEFMRQVYPNRVMYAHTRYRGKIGSAPRLLCMAALLGASEIDVVGMDGLKKETKLGDPNDHSFEKGKPSQGTLNYRLYNRHYVALWDYLLNDIGKEVIFRNLGEGHETNMTSDISAQMFQGRG